VIVLKPFSLEFAAIFGRYKRKIKRVLPQAQVHHIGSSAVYGLGGKGIVDILVAISNWQDKQTAVNKLKQLGFTHIHQEVNQRIFLSKIANTGYKDVHIHLTYVDSPEYAKLLAFRDYLISHPKEADRYYKLKQDWFKQAGGNRQKYNRLKSDYIQSVLAKARADKKH